MLAMLNYEVECRRNWLNLLSWFSFSFCRSCQLRLPFSRLSTVSGSLNLNMFFFSLFRILSTERTALHELTVYYLYIQNTEYSVLWLRHKEYRGSSSRAYDDVCGWWHGCGWHHWVCMSLSSQQFPLFIWSRCRHMTSYWCYIHRVVASPSQNERTKYDLKLKSCLKMATVNDKMCWIERE